MLRLVHRGWLVQDQETTTDIFTSISEYLLRGMRRNGIIIERPSEVRCTLPIRNARIDTRYYVTRNPQNIRMMAFFPALILQYNNDTFNDNDIIRLHLLPDGERE